MARASPKPVQVQTCPSLGEALAMAGAPPLLVISGSLHFLGEAMEALHFSPVPSNGERALNEWHMVGR